MLIRGGLVLVVLGAIAAAVMLWPRDPVRLRRNALNRGNQYYAEKKIPEAILMYRSAIQIDPRFGEAHARLADAYAELGDARNAFAEYVTAADLLPRDVPAQLRAGSALLLMGFAKEAGARAAAVLALDPGNLDAKILQANVAAGLKNLDDAVTQMYAVSESVAERPADQARVLLHLGVMELARGHQGEAETLLRQASAREASSVTNHLALANYYWALGRHGDAEGELRRVLAIDPHESRANRALAALYIATGRVAEAEAPLTQLAASTTEPGARLVLADYFIVSARERDAVALLRDMARDTAFFAQAQLRLALLEYQAGRVERADAIVDTTLAREPKHPTVLLMKARLLADRGQFEPALARVDAALALDGRSVEAHYLRASILTARREPAAAIAALNQVIKLRPTLTDALVRLSVLHLARSDADTAARFAIQAVANAPQSVEARIALIRAQLARNSSGDAERELRPLLDANPQAPVVLTLWGRLLAVKGDAAGARRSLRDAIRLDPSSLEPLAELVALEVPAGRAGEVLPLVQARLAQAPGDAEAWLLAARIFEAQGRTADEESALLRVIDVDPGNLRAFGALGQFYLAANRVPDARRQFEELARRKPDSAGAFTMLALIQELDGKPLEAEKTYEHALAIDSQAAVAANNLAWLQVRRGGNLDVALQLAQTATTAFPNEPEFKDTLGWIYLQKQLPDSALPPLLDSVRAVPGNPGFRYHLGMAHLARAEYREARAHRERALSLQVPFEGQDDARLQLERVRRLPAGAGDGPEAKTAAR